MSDVTPVLARALYPQGLSVQKKIDKLIRERIIQKRRNEQQRIKAAETLLRFSKKNVASLKHVPTEILISDRGKKKTTKRKRRKQKKPRKTRGGKNKRTRKI